MPFLIPVVAAIGGGSALAGSALIASTAAGVYGASKSAKAIKNASSAQAASAQAGIDEQRRQFDVTQGNLAPFLQGGTQALGGQKDLLGLNGGEAQQGAITALQDSPLYQSLFRNGQNTVLANGSATGGLRGGNLQRGLADFGSDTLAQVIENQLKNLGGLASNGQNAATNLGGLGQNSADSIGTLLQQQGAAKSGGILGVQNANNDAISVLLAGLGKGLGGIKSTLGGGNAPVLI